MRGQYLLRALFATLGLVASDVLNNLPVHALTVASIGDSYASGEGNPDEPQKFDVFGFVEKGPIWADRQCHRSRFAGPFLAANEIARLVNQVNQPLTFIGLACTG